MDEARGRPWGRDTLVDVFSMGKAMAAVCVLLLSERGQARPRRPGRRLLARVRDGRQGGDHLADGALPSRRSSGIRRKLPDRRSTMGLRCAKPLRRRSHGGRPGRSTAITSTRSGSSSGKSCAAPRRARSVTFFSDEVGSRSAPTFVWDRPVEDGRIAEYLFTASRRNSKRAVKASFVETHCRRDASRAPTSTRPGSQVWDGQQPRGAERRSRPRTARDRTRGCRVYAALAAGAVEAPILVPETIDEAITEALPAWTTARPALALRARLPAHPARAPARSRTRAASATSARAARWACRPRRGAGVRLRDEPLRPALAEPAQQGARRGGLPLRLAAAGQLLGAWGRPFMGAPYGAETLCSSSIVGGSGGASISSP